MSQKRHNSKKCDIYFNPTLTLPEGREQSSQEGTQFCIANIRGGGDMDEVKI
jgi:hypothetical protein